MEFCDRFDSWSDSTKVRRIYDLDDFGDENEVYEIAVEYSYLGAAPCTKFLKKAVKAGVRFSPENILVLAEDIESDFLGEFVDCNHTPYTREQLEELSYSVDKKTLKKLLKKNGTKHKKQKPQTEKGPGCFFAIFVLLGALLGVSAPKKKRHNGKCDGDCANCPPHYGYRYGRWYYGHGHNHGCEFGGNKGGGGMD